MTRTAVERHKVGTHVSWQDAGGNGLSGTIETVSVDDHARHPYGVRWDGGSLVFTDLSEPGWLIDAPDAPPEPKPWPHEHLTTAGDWTIERLTLDGTPLIVLEHGRAMFVFTAEHAEELAIKVWRAAQAAR